MMCICREKLSPGHSGAAPGAWAEDKPAVDLNRRIMAEFAPKLRPFYYDPKKYRTYLEQLGVTYPRVKMPVVP